MINGPTFWHGAIWACQWNSGRLRKGGPGSVCALNPALNHSLLNRDGRDHDCNDFTP